MKRQLRCFCSFLCTFVLVSCAAVGVSPQPVPPGDINSTMESPSPTAAPLTFPQMTGTAEAIPTVVYPTEKPLTSEEIFSLSQLKITSPDGNYVITCDSGFPILFYAPTKTVISTANRVFGCADHHRAWSPDNSYVFLVEGGTQDIYRWHIDGSQPEVIHLNTEANPSGVDCDVKFLWGLDAEFLVIEKGCNLYSVEPDDESSFAEPLPIASCCFYDFHWATPDVLMVEYNKVYSFVHVPSGNWIGLLDISSGICPRQIPLISPDERWMVFDFPWCGGGGQGPNQSVIANLEDGSKRVFSESFADRIDLVGWSPDSSQLYLVSRPTQLDALPDPRTPFGLLAMDPETLQVQNLFEQAWFVSFNKDLRWAYVVFPVKNEDGNFRLDGGVWEIGTSQLIGRQIMANSLEERFLEPIPYFTVQPFYSATGKELGSSSTAAGRLIPAIWSHDHLKVATINTDHQLVVIDIQGKVQTIAQLGHDWDWLNSDIKWSDTDQAVSVNDVTWTIP